MMTDCRSFLQHAQGVFDAGVLHGLRQYLGEIAAERQARLTCERERRAVARGEGSDALRLDERWMDVWRHPSPKLVDVIGAFSWVCHPCQVRHVTSASEHLVPWHQDAAFIQLLGRRAHDRVVSFFVPIDDDPAARTTLSFGSPVERLLPHQPTGGFDAGLPDWPEDGTWHSLALGDGLFFGDLMPHRTFTPPGAQVARASLEFRLVRPSDAIPDKDYFDVLSGRFVRRSPDFGER